MEVHLDTVRVNATGGNLIRLVGNAGARAAESTSKTFTKWMQCGRSAPISFPGSRSPRRPPVPGCLAKSAFQFNCR